MKWSHRLGTFFGIGVDVHLTFLLLLGWIAWSTYASTGSMLAVLGGVLFVLMLFVFVVMHEYGHALTARRFGIRTRGITLYPIGGVASLEGMPKSPREQLLIAVAGPAVNFVLAAAIALLMVLVGEQPLALDIGVGPTSLLEALLYANLLMGSFNLLPALPMDGGRVLRAFLEMRMGAVRATDVAARVARVVALGMGIFAFVNDNPILFAIAVMVWFMSGIERRQARQVEAMRAMEEARSFGLQGMGPFGHVPRARPPSMARPTTSSGGRPVAGRPRVVVEVVEGPEGPVARLVRD